MKAKKIIATLSTLALLAGCGSTAYKDGSYEGHFVNEEKNEKLDVVLEVKDGKITSCDMKEYDQEGNLKDETYGDQYEGKLQEAAKLAYEGFSQYPDLLIEAQSVDDFDAISGATSTYKKFKEAVDDALKQAK